MDMGDKRLLKKADHARDAGRCAGQEIGRRGGPIAQKATPARLVVPEREEQLREKTHRRGQSIMAE